MTDPREQARGTRLRPSALIAIAAAAAAAAGLAAVYGIGGFGRNDVEAACRPALETVRRMAPLAHGEVAAVAVAREPRRVPDLAFADGSGTPRTLAEWRGRTVLLNLWATWCVPCRKEMPALDGLEQRLGGPGFQVVAINIDQRDPDKPRAWLREASVDHLAYFADPSAKVFQDLKAVGWAFGMPTTVLVDPHGCDLGIIAGPAEWTSADALALVEAALGSVAP
jgi:thiol-disulfide isomerase/thioredoxin